MIKTPAKIATDLQNLTTCGGERQITVYQALLRAVEAGVVLGSFKPVAELDLSKLPKRMSFFHGADRDTGAPCVYDVISEEYVEALELLLRIKKKEGA